MARTTGRSRGCRTCRQRRIKCDEALPECTQCKKNQRKCPGPITGTFYIIVSDTCTSPSSSPMSPSGLSQISKITEPDNLPPSVDSSEEEVQTVVQYALPTTNTPVSQVYDTPTMIKSPIKIPFYYQPSRTSVYEQLYLFHYFDLYGRGVETIGSCSWISKLPDRMATSFSSRSMKYSARATSMVFYGILNGEVAIQTEARRTYARALAAQRVDIYQDIMQPCGSRTPVSEETISTTLMMCYFELFAKTTPLAWMQHLDAATAMAETKGPEDFQSPFAHQLFRSVKLGVAFASVLRKTPHVFAHESWKTIPYQQPKKQLDNLVDVILSIPEYISLSETIFNTTFHFEPRKSLQKLRAGLSSLISNLDNQIHYNLNAPAQTESLPTPFSNDEFSPQPALFSAPMIGCLAAIRHAAYLICFSLLASMDTGDSNNEDQAFHHSEAVLNAAAYVDTCSKSRASSLFMTIIFSLNVVSEWSPSPIHRSYALKKLNS